MKYRFLLAAPLVLACCLLLPGRTFAAGIQDRDLDIHISTSVNSLDTESGVIAVEEFPVRIPLSVTARTGTITDIQLEFQGVNRSIPPDTLLTIESKEQCGPYTLTARTDRGAVLTLTANIVYQVKAAYDIRYRTVGMAITAIYEGETLLKTFVEPQHIDLVDANTVPDGEKERIAGWIGRCDGGTYTLKGSLEVEIHNIASGAVYGTYDTRKDFIPLTKGYGWTEKTLTAFSTMRDTALTYQAPVNIDIRALWCDESKREVYGSLTAKDKGVPALLYPYRTASVTFHKDDLKMSRNYQYMGLEWEYKPQTEKYTNGENKTQTEITQEIHYQIPAARFYFKFKACESNDLSVMIQAPATVKRGDPYSFTVIYMNSGQRPVYDVPLKGTVDDKAIGEIPAIRDFPANTSQSYVIERTADTAAGEIHLWANIGVPEGFIDGNLGNNTATAVIRVVDPEPEPTVEPTPPENPVPPQNPPEKPPEKKTPCDLSAAILAPPTVYEQQAYSFTVSFTNQSTVDLKSVLLKGTNNGNLLAEVPVTADFQAGEVKTYTVTGKAGNAGEIYHLQAAVEAPEGFRDESPMNNTAVSKITVVKKPQDTPDTPHDPDNPDDPDKPDHPDKPDNPEKP